MLQFKIWDKNKKVMSGILSFADLYGYEGECNAVTTKNGKISIVQHNGGNCSFYPLKTVQDGINPDIVILRVSHQKDKNGNLITEHDILCNSEYQLEVKYDEELDTFVVYWNGLMPSSLSVPLSDLTPYFSKWEIIGNTEVIKWK